eukprot:scaffold3125_cov73-Isochrysis_galbana.AAC.1
MLLSSRAIAPPPHETQSRPVTGYSPARADGEELLARALPPPHLQHLQHAETPSLLHHPQAQPDCPGGDPPPPP